MLMNCYDLLSLSSASSDGVECKGVLSSIGLGLVAIAKESNICGTSFTMIRITKLWACYQVKLQLQRCKPQRTCKIPALRGTIYPCMRSI